MFSPGGPNLDIGRLPNCIYAFDRTASLASDGDGVRFEQRSYDFHYDPPEAPHDCSVEQARKLAAGKACNNLTVIRGKRVADLE
jgi:hypothetical protein